MRRIFVGVAAFVLLVTLTVVSGTEGPPRAAGGEARLAQQEAPAPENPLIGTPYLQLGQGGESNSAKIDVVWHAIPDASAWSVEFQETTENSRRMAAQAKFRLVDIQRVSVHRIYNATISRLKPGEPFDYRLLRNGKLVRPNHTESTPFWAELCQCYDQFSDQLSRSVRNCGPPPQTKRPGRNYRESHLSGSR